MNLPNLISLARLLSVPLTVWLVLIGQHTLAFWLFVAAGISDAVDGYIAKHFNARSELGGYLDPIADKVLLVSVYVTLGYRGELDSWLVILVVSRDILIVGGSLLTMVLTDKFVIAPLVVSKINTAAQIALAGLVLAQLGLGFSLAVPVTALVYVVAATTSVSGAAYLVAWWRRIVTSEEGA